MNPISCVLNPAGCAATLAKSSAGDLLNAVTGWVVASVQWFIASLGSVLDATSDANVVLRGSRTEYHTLVALAPGLLVVGLLIATLQALQRADVAGLWRLYLGVAPACVLAVLVARPVASLILQSVDQLAGAAAASVAGGEARLTVDFLHGVAPTMPGFGVLILALAMVVGALALWCELVVRTVALSVLLVLVPLLVPLCVVPALRRMGGRLVETFIAVAASKLLIVVTLTLGLNEVLGSSLPGVITGVVTLALASATPFVLLRLVPVVEHSALHALDGIRQRAVRGGASLATSPLVQAAQGLLPDEPLPGPPERAEDWGLPLWPSEETITMPEQPEQRPPAPVGSPEVRRGHVVYRRDHAGPVVGWHWDD